VTYKKFVLILNLVALVVIATSCAKAAKEEGSAATSNANQQEVLLKTPHLSSAVRGDIERIGMAVQTARDAAQQGRWPEVTTQLQGANREVTSALADTPEKKKTAIIRQNLEEFKVALERTIKAAENRDKETESQLSDLQTRVSALKAYSAQER
jgi:hypothetical protein